MYKNANRLTVAARAAGRIAMDDTPEIVVEGAKGSGAGFLSSSESCRRFVIVSNQFIDEQGLLECRAAVREWDD
ncbi:MAG: hypothetical protein LZF86_80158 [Nitrospira sp.]|nr:MAG: hypothetical protein LZF86_80158 [Nitrospira sp.]